MGGKLEQQGVDFESNRMNHQAGFEEADSVFGIVRIILQDALWGLKGGFRQVVAMYSKKNGSRMVQTAAAAEPGGVDAGAFPKLQGQTIPELLLPGIGA